MKRIFSVGALTLMFALIAVADVRFDTPTPKPEKTPTQVKSIDTTLYISLQKDAKEARLLIPKSQIKQLRMELAALDDDADAPVAAGYANTQTVVGGLFLSLAFVFGGVWFARSRKIDLKANKTAAVGAILFLSGALAAAAYANVALPSLEARSITGLIFTDAVHQYKKASGKIKVESTDDSYGITLIVPDAGKAKSEE